MEMSDALLTQLTDFGALGIFAAFLLYQHFSMQKRLDLLVEKFQAQLRDIQTRCDENEEKLRDRYDSVVATYRAEKDQIMATIVKTVEDNARKLDTALGKLDK